MVSCADSVKWLILFVFMDNSIVKSDAKFIIYGGERT
jgi:hypothetical protein